MSFRSGMYSTFVWVGMTYPGGIAVCSYSACNLLFLNANACFFCIGHSPHLSLHSSAPFFVQSAPLGCTLRITSLGFSPQCSSHLEFSNFANYLKFLCPSLRVISGWSLSSPGFTKCLAICRWTWFASMQNWHLPVNVEPFPDHKDFVVDAFHLD